jgi:CspA family cold shock protein
MKVGKVKAFKTKNGCGFIIDAAGGKDVFVHVSSILENAGDPSDILVPGEEVEYEVFDSRRGPAARNVRRLHPQVLIEFTGRVKKYLSNEGYGFIGSEEQDVFFHCTDLLSPSVAVGEEVTYLKAIVQGKPRAVRVRSKVNV